LQYSSTSKFINNLYQECRALNVQFRFRQEVSSIDRMKSGKLKSADIAKVGDPERVISIQCNNLVLATGSNTPDTLHEIVPWMEPRTTLVNNKQHCDWVRISAPTLRNADKVGLVIRDHSGGDSTIMAAQPGQEILVATVRPENQHAPFNDSNTNAQARSQLRDTEVSDDYSAGHTTISTALDKLPMVCKIPSKLIDDRFAGGEDKTPMGIYLAYGFGMYGTTMSLGVATALRRMIAGEDARIGDAFSYP
jgi:glycine/D-amino acid oxidase-like deaminating enzyme